MIVQRASFRYQQSVNRLYEVGSPNIYIVVGRTQGQASFSQVLGPTKLKTPFYQQFGNACNMANNNMTLTTVTGCGSNDPNAGEETIQVNNSVITSFGLSVAAEQMIFQQELNLMFLFLQME